MLKAFQENNTYDETKEKEDIEYFLNHPLNCREITPEMLDKPEFQALQNLAYDGTSEEVCKNFKDQAMETLSSVLLKSNKSMEHDKVECERAMHFFTEAFETGYKEPNTLFTLYMGRAKLNLLIAQFGKCKEDCLEALKLRPKDDQMWLILSRSRYFLEKWSEGLKYAEDGLKVCPTSAKLQNMKVLF